MVYEKDFGVSNNTGKKKNRIVFWLLLVFFAVVVGLVFRYAELAEEKEAYYESFSDPAVVKYLESKVRTDVTDTEKEEILRYLTSSPEERNIDSN